MPKRFIKRYTACQKFLPNGGTLLDKPAVPPARGPVIISMAPIDIDYLEIMAFFILPGAIAK